MALRDKFIVRLTAEQRKEPEGPAAAGKRPAAVLARARIPLKADADADGRTDDRIAEAPDASPATVARVRKKFVGGAWRRPYNESVPAAARTASSTARPRRG